MATKQERQKEALRGLDQFSAVLDKALSVAEKDPDALEGMHARQGNPITLGPRVRESTDWSEKQTTNAAAAGERWLKGVTSPRKNPIEAAKAAEGKWKTRMQEAITQGRFGRGLNLIVEDEMYATIRDGGAAPFTSGVERRRGKINRVVGELRPMVVALAETLDKMPTTTREQREAKMIAAKRGMEEIGNKRRGIK